MPPTIVSKPGQVAQFIRPLLFAPRLTPALVLLQAEVARLREEWRAEVEGLQQELQEKAEMYDGWLCAERQAADLGMTQSEVGGWSTSCVCRHCRCFWLDSQSPTRCALACTLHCCLHYLQLHPCINLRCSAVRRRLGATSITPGLDWCFQTAISWAQ
jgi:hypothetical protein